MDEDTRRTVQKWRNQEVLWIAIVIILILIVAAYGEAPNDAASFF